MWTVVGGIILAALVIWVFFAVIGGVGSLLIGAIGAAGDAKRSATVAYARTKWKLDNPVDLSPPQFSPALVIEWTGSLNAHADDLVGHWDPDRETPSEWDEMRADNARDLAKWLAANAAAVAAGTPPDPSWQHRIDGWIEAAESCLRYRTAGIERLQDPETYWDAKVEAVAVEELVVWLMNKRSFYPAYVAPPAPLPPGATARKMRSRPPN